MTSMRTIKRISTNRIECSTRLPSGLSVQRPTAKTPYSVWISLSKCWVWFCFFFLNWTNRWMQTVSSCTVFMLLLVYETHVTTSCDELSVSSSARYVPPPPLQLSPFKASGPTTKCSHQSRILWVRFTCRRAIIQFLAGSKIYTKKKKNPETGKTLACHIMSIHIMWKRNDRPMKCQNGKLARRHTLAASPW